MPRLPARLERLLRTSFLAMLVLGLVIKPVLNQIGAMHAAEHAQLADADGHGHDHPGDQVDDHGHDHEPSGADHEPGQDHTQGAHGLMHQASVGATADVWAGLPTVLAGPASQEPPLPDPPMVRARSLSTPFRPPIA